MIALNRLQYILTAKTQYNIQSPFLFRLYNEILNSRLNPKERERLGIAKGDRYAELRHMIGDHYGATPVNACDWGVDDLFSSPEVGLIGMVRKPHADKTREARWRELTQKEEVTLSVDLFDVGILFTSDKLSKEHVILRIF